MNICVIPARGGSRRIPHKNRKLFHGKPIIAYSIETARVSGLFSDIYVSTDDQETIDIASSYGCRIHLRSNAYLKGDKAGTQEVVQDCLWSSTSGQHNYACCLYATAPLLSPKDLAVAMEILKRNQTVRYVVGTGTAPLRDAGAFYLGRAQEFMDGAPLYWAHTVAFPLPEHRVCDINTPEDWARAEELYAELNDLDSYSRYASEGVFNDRWAKCAHDYKVQNVGHALPEMIHFRCTKCGESLPT